MAKDEGVEAACLLCFAWPSCRSLEAALSLHLSTHPNKYMCIQTIAYTNTDNININQYIYIYIYIYTYTYVYVRAHTFGKSVEVQHKAMQPVCQHLRVCSV